ncbi:hypothetical protein PAAG_11724 [Paracoccidioides lutzii Pb01]|uniref:Uncharacterized protein n=1 Tax=Paracoccidioides lutzii (strain ATCC MYA-826 / Pb01) TaxID=502779 RepID=A0A0A2V1C5_PARBA|nr:hypothetical protein PAAG_11724 [Paracoccidioides lutzii Pb01]KGQ01596.1 hypothetical protein PAAG_11724 [Paracoccidioides lutzii Pb01]
MSHNVDYEELNEFKPIKLVKLTVYSAVPRVIQSVQVRAMSFSCVEQSLIEAIISHERISQPGLRGRSIPLHYWPTREDEGRAKEYVARASHSGG